MSNRRLGVYICHCGGNISDYVDVDRIKDAIKDEPDVIETKTTMFTCSDASQQEIINDIKEKNLDGIVVASCSPKLHLFTFRDVAKRAGLNQYQYIQVNLREQDSWAHTDDKEGATKKGIRLLRNGIAKARLTEPLNPMKVETVPRVLVVGAGIAGLRAAIGLSDLGIEVHIIEKSPAAGGWMIKFEKIYPHNRNGKKIVENFITEIKKRDNIFLYTNTEIVEKSGSLGNFSIKLKTRDKDELSINVGSIIVATGFNAYQPQTGEFGYGIDNVITLPEFKELIDKSNGKIIYNNREINNIVYIYCVGSRQQPTTENANKYCSSYCCNAVIHSSILVSEINPKIHQFHLYRDIRTYGKYEILYEEACKKGSVFIEYNEDNLPIIEKSDGKVKVLVKDMLTAGEELEINTDLVVLVTGMVPRENKKLIDVLKLPVGLDKFFNEIHPKLRPVETVVDGVFICGTSQSPKNSSESVASALAAAAKSASLLMKGYVELEPVVATIYPDLCSWCGLCLEVCPYDAITREKYADKEIAVVSNILCKGCGACVPVCPYDAVDLKYYTDHQIKAMIDALAQEV